MFVSPYELSTIYKLLHYLDLKYSIHHFLNVILTSREV
jgi:hypothetical protein